MVSECFCCCLGQLLSRDDALGLPWEWVRVPLFFSWCAICTGGSVLLAPHRKIISFLPSLIFFSFFNPPGCQSGPYLSHSHNSHHPAAMHLIFLEWAHCLYGCIQRCLLLFLLSPASISPYPEHLPLLHQPSASPPSLHPFSNMHMSKPVQELSKPFIIAGLAAIL